jgi:hypothetical protein
VDFNEIRLRWTSTRSGVGGASTALSTSDLLEACQNITFNDLPTPCLFDNLPNDLPDPNPAN